MKPFQKVLYRLKMKDLSPFDETYNAERFSECVYYDYDLKELSSSFDSLYKTFKRIRKRAERRQTVQISKSLFDYYEKKQDIIKIPQKYFDFRCDNDRICVYKYRNFYSVLCVGFDYPSQGVKRFEYWSGAGTPYGKFSIARDAIPLFIEIVYWYVTNILTTLNIEDVPF